MKVAVEETMNCTSDDFLELVLDVRRYAEVDDKIGRIDWVRRDENQTVFKFTPVLPGIPGPSPKMVMLVDRVSRDRIEMSMSPLPYNRLNHKLLTFLATFDCTPVEGGIRVRSEIVFTFARAVAWLMEPLMERKLPPNLQDEMTRAEIYMARQTSRAQAHTKPEAR